MQTHLEIEYKILISEDKYTELSTLYKQYQSITQTNVYYDSSISPLHPRGLSLRIRDRLDKHILTLKKRCDEGLQEYEFEVPCNHIEVFRNPHVLPLCQEFEIGEPIYESAKLTTHRREVPFKHGVLCIDKNEYYEITDYEIEFEVYEDAKLGFNEFMNLLNEINIPYIENKISKTKRCHNAKKSQK